MLSLSSAGVFFVHAEEKSPSIRHTSGLFDSKWTEKNKLDSELNY